MQTAECARFIDYVARTSRPVARAKREAMSLLLDGHETKSILELCGRVGGNTKDRAWVSQAMKDGEIVCVGGVLKLPSQREVITDESIKHDWDRCLRAVDRAVDALEYCFCDEDQAEYVQLLAHAVRQLKVITFSPPGIR